MKKMVLALAFLTLVFAFPVANAGTRVSVGFSYGDPYHCYRPAYARPVVVRTYPRYRYKRFYRPYYSRVYFNRRPYARVVVRDSH